MERVTWKIIIMWSCDDQGQGDVSFHSIEVKLHEKNKSQHLDQYLFEILSNKDIAY